MGMSHHDALLRRHAGQLLAELAEQAAPAGPLAVHAGDGSVFITITLVPAGYARADGKEANG